MLRRTFSVIVIAFVLCAFFVMVQSRVTAQSPEPPNTAPSQVVFGLPFTYQGQLKKGNAPVTGDCSMAFRLYDDWSEGNQIGYPITVTISASGGLFTAPLDFGSNALTGDTRWLGIWVKCLGDWMYTDLGRQLIAAAPYAMTLKSGAVISANMAAASVLNVANTNSSTSGGNAISAINYSGDAWQPAIYGENNGASAGVYGRSDGGNAVVGWNQSNDRAGVYGNNIGSGTGVRGESTEGTGVYGRATTTAAVNAYGVYGESSAMGAAGVYGKSTSHIGVWGVSTAWTGVYGLTSYGSSYGNFRPSGVAGYNSANWGSGAGVEGGASSPDGYGGYFSHDDGGVALQAVGNGDTHDRAALRVENTNTTSGIASYMKNNSSLPTLEMDQHGSGPLLDLQTWGAGDFIAGYDSSVHQKFRIDANGTGHSSGGWSTSAQDYAEMLPAVKGLEPGDVLIVGGDGQLARSTQPYQASVVGVYSTQPGFVGGLPVEGPITGTIPLAIVGIVPVKVSAESGVVHPGDLLVASSIPGHAMKAGSNPPVGTVIGKALEKFDSGTGVIKMLVTLR